MHVQFNWPHLLTLLRHSYFAIWDALKNNWVSLWILMPANMCRPMHPQNMLTPFIEWSNWKRSLSQIRPLCCSTSSYVKWETLKKQYCTRGGTNKWRHTIWCYCISKLMTKRHYKIPMCTRGKFSTSFWRPDNANIYICNLFPSTAWSQNGTVDVLLGCWESCREYLQLVCTDIMNCFRLLVCCS